MHDGSAIARITDLYVLPDARKVGIGEALILEIEGWAKERGAFVTFSADSVTTMSRE